MDNSTPDFILPSAEKNAPDFFPSDMKSVSALKVEAPQGQLLAVTALAMAPSVFIAFNVLMANRRNKIAIVSEKLSPMLGGWQRLGLVISVLWALFICFVALATPVAPFLRDSIMLAAIIYIPISGLWLLGLIVGWILAGFRP
jgi:hypothetical protein